MQQRICYFSRTLSYAGSLSRNSALDLRIALGSFSLKKTHGTVTVFNLDKKAVQAKIQVECTPSKVLWSPAEKDKDLLAITTTSLSLWEEGANEYRCVQRMNKSMESQLGPLTSMDWSPADAGTIITSSTDRTCVVWDIETGKETLCLRLHEAMIYDISFSSKPWLFCTVGEDTSLRLTDRRSFSKTALQYEDPRGRSLARVEWNRLNDDYIAHLALHSNTVEVTDIRAPNTTLFEFGMEENATSICWSPETARHLASADNTQIKIWDLDRCNASKTFDSLYIYEQRKIDAAESIQCLSWEAQNPEKIFVGTNRRAEIFQI